MSYESLQNRQISVYKISSTLVGGQSTFNSNPIGSNISCAIRPLGTRESYISQNVELDILASHIVYAEDRTCFVVGNGIKITGKKDRNNIWNYVADGSEFIILTKIENADSRGNRVIMQIGPLTKRTVGS
jgi:hypothetical protein